ncbi:MAG: CRISPR-associated helicase Cas3' [Treponema sp.]|nr:CRISPR-associated helicase Cas3' [Treponema sp.]
MIRSKNTRTETAVLPLSDCLAKSRVLENGEKASGIDVFGHCVIVGEVANALIRYSIPAIRARLFPPGSELIAAVHDVGKLCPSFQEKVRAGMKHYQRNSLPGLENAAPEQEKAWGGHAAVSQAALGGCPKYIPEIAGRHHGRSTKKCPPDSDYFGGASWQNLRETLIEQLKAWFDVPWPELKSNTHAALLSGLTCVADWIGSGSSFDGIEHVTTTGDLRRRADAALETAGFIRPVVKPGFSFRDVFDFDPYPVQSRFIEALSAPGLYVLEAPMGMGKTEAALYGAYKILESGKASGVYFALPTRLTSDKIHERVNTFLDRVLDPASPHRSARLLHSSAWLHETELGEEGKPGGSWFDARKRGILAPFGVGTIDQALMAVMNVKHGFVRTFGLAGKVVILDEVHSYDSYTGVILDELVRGLGELGCTIIILSATLTDERRKELTGAKGLSPVPAYPLISYIRESDTKPREIPVEPPDAMNIALRRTDDSAAIEEALKRAERGQQVLWIENTVDQAQELYGKLSGRAAECSAKTGLLHSRFTQADRKANEALWVGLYGEEGRARRGETGRILVGTQVLEQSLDIDADFLVTRLCPTDMLLQRIGRLWRHRKTDPLRPRDARPETWILAADYEQVLDNYKKELGTSAFVYDPYVLLRTLELWENLASLSLPGDIRRLVEETYNEREEEGIRGRLKHNLEKKRDHLRNMALSGLAIGGVTRADTETSTRYSEQETVDVLLLRSAEKDEAGSISLTFTDGESLELPAGLTRKDGREWRERAAALSRHIVTVPEKRAPLPTQRRFLEWFRDYLYIGGDDENGILRIAIVNKSGDLEGKDACNITGNYELSYTSVCGYRSVKKKITEDDNSW